MKSVFKQETFVGKPVHRNSTVNREKVPKNVVKNVKYWFPPKNHSQDIRTRCFYNSALDKRKSQGLLAKGNKHSNLKKGVQKSTFLKCCDEGKFPVLDKKVMNVCTDHVNVDICSHKNLGNKDIAPVGQGTRKQVAPVTCEKVRSIERLGGNVNHSAPCEANLHIANGKPGVYSVGQDEAFNRCQKVDNGQSGFDSIVLKEVLTESKGENKSPRCESVIDKGVNGVDTSNKTANGKPGIYSVGQDVAFNRCQKVDNGQSGFDSIVLKEVLTESKGENKSPRCERVIDEGVNGVDTSNKTVPLFDIKWSSDDKFVNTLFTKSLKIPSQDVEVQQLLAKWRKQSDFNFGFVPVSQFIIPDVHVQDGSTIECPIKMHKTIRASGAPNFLKCRIPVESQLNIGVWKKVLADYWDVQLIHLLEYGFPLDFNRRCSLFSEHKNHSSANEFPDHVDAYLDEERHFNAILGPFTENPIPGAHSSPFMTREKSDSEKRRVIVDLSWPKHASVNAGVDKDSYLGTDFILTFPTVDDIIQEVKSLGKGCHLYKVDISRAFRHVKIDPHDYDLLGLEWRNASYFDTCLPFGNRHGTQIFQRISDAVRYVMRHRGVKIINYVDDFVGVATPDVARHSFDALRDMLAQLGLDVSVKKLISPATAAICLGVNIDTCAGTVSIPNQKLRQICDMVNQWGDKKFCSKRQLQSLLGYLLYIHKCVKPSRTFLNRMLGLLRDNYDKKTITLTQDFKRDLRWFQRFLTQYNGISFFDHTPVDGVLELDACLTGLGGRWGSFVYHLPLAHHLKNLAIVHIEMINILVATRIFAKYWHRKHILVRCDNMAVVQVLSSGKTKDPFLAMCARNVWLTAALADIDLEYRHIAGRSNETADLLSRWSFAEKQYHRLHALVKNPMWMETNSTLLELDYHI